MKLFILTPFEYGGWGVTAVDDTEISLEITPENTCAFTSVGDLIPNLEEKLRDVENSQTSMDDM